MSNTSGTIAVNSGSSGTVTVGGTGALWANSANLTVGGAGSGRLFVNTGGRVTVGGTTTVGGSGSIIMGGGTLEFGSMSLTDYPQITGSSGTLIGSLGNFSGFTDVSTLPAVPSLPGINTAGVVVTNSGVMYGNAILNHGLHNLAAGEVETSGSERMRSLATEPTADRSPTSARKFASPGRPSTPQPEMSRAAGSSLPMAGGRIRAR